MGGKAGEGGEEHEEMQSPSLATAKVRKVPPHPLSLTLRGYLRTHHASHPTVPPPPHTHTFTHPVGVPPPRNAHHPPPPPSLTLRGYLRTHHAHHPPPPPSLTLRGYLRTRHARHFVKVGVVGQGGCREQQVAGPAELNAVSAADRLHAGQEGGEGASEPAVSRKKHTLHSPKTRLNKNKKTRRPD